MIDEIMEDSALLKAQMRKDGCKDPEATLNGFFEKTGLDLSDVMYRKESSDQLWRYMLTGKTPENPKGFDYTDTIKAGYCKRHEAKWIAAHTYERRASGMTKSEAKKKIESIIETAGSLREELTMLELEAYDAYLAVKPYEGMNELTTAQEELLYWFYEIRIQANEAKHALDCLEDMTK